MNRVESKTPDALETAAPDAGVVGRYSRIARAAEWASLVLLGVAAVVWSGGAPDSGSGVAGLALAWGAALLMLATPGIPGAQRVAPILLAWLFCLLCSESQGVWTVDGRPFARESSLLLSAIALGALGYWAAPPSRRWLLALLIAVVPLSFIVLPPLLVEGPAAPLPWKAWVYALCLIEFAGLFHRLADGRRNQYRVAGWSAAVGFVILAGLMGGSP